MISAQQVIDTLGLIPLEDEGGMYRNSYNSEDLVGTKPICTAIYYLLTENTFSHLHRLASDELYHFYLGDPMELVQIDTHGTLKTIVLGQDILAGQQVQAVVTKEIWQGSRLLPGGKFALVGTTMAPGYVQEEYEHANAAELCRQYPAISETIARFTGDVSYF